MTEIPKDFDSAFGSAKLSGIRQFDRILGVLKTLELDVGFLSRGKANRRKVHFNILQTGERTVKRSPIPLAEKSSEAEKLMEEFHQEIANTIERQVNMATDRQSSFDPRPEFKQIYMKFGKKYEKVIQDQFSELPPVKLPHAGNKTPLVQTGKLLKSIRSKFYRKRRAKTV